MCRAVADALEARFNPVAVRGEVSGFSRAASGHCYFSLKDGDGQIRCAMFRRAAGLLDFAPKDGDSVEVLGRLDVYGPRGDLQLIVESLSRAGQGALFEQFLRLKARLEGEGLFDPTRKRPLPGSPRGIGLVTSTGAAALHDVVTCLTRRVPHIPVVLAPAAVQGAQAASDLVRALTGLYALAEAGTIDVILLVRGGGSIEDLWAFNDEQLARTIARSPVPVVSGVGHETDFTIADFVA
ncbi:MAG: xseA, partial [Ramlibacter sp.]|nr:xseA [Ramlibacter sp.]